MVDGGDDDKAVGAAGVRGAGDGVGWIGGKYRARRLQAGHGRRGTHLADDAICPAYPSCASRVERTAPVAPRRACARQIHFQSTLTCAHNTCTHAHDACAGAHSLTDGIFWAVWLVISVAFGR